MQVISSTCNISVIFQRQEANARIPLGYARSRVGDEDIARVKVLKPPRKTATCCVFQGRRTVHYTDCTDSGGAGRGFPKCSNNNQAARARGLVHIVEHRHSELGTPLPPPPSSAINLTPLTLSLPLSLSRSLCVPIRTLGLWRSSPFRRTRGYIAICTAATINLLESITVLETDSAIQRRQLQRAPKHAPQCELRATCAIHSCACGWRIAFSWRADAPIKRAINEILVNCLQGSQWIYSLQQAAKYRSPASC